MSAADQTSEVELADTDFHFTPQRRELAGKMTCPKNAITGLIHRSGQFGSFTHLFCGAEQRRRFGSTLALV
jgi:hypothetical protein